MDAKKVKKKALLALILAVAGVAVALAAGAVVFVVPPSAGINIAIVILTLLAGGIAYAGIYLAARAKEESPADQAGRRSAGFAGGLGWVGFALAGWVLLYLLSALAYQTGVRALIGLGEVVQTLLVILAAAAIISGLAYLVLGVVFGHRRWLLAVSTLHLISGALGSAVGVLVWINLNQLEQWLATFSLDASPLHGWAVEFGALALGYGLLHIAAGLLLALQPGRFPWVRPLSALLHTVTAGYVLYLAIVAFGQGSGGFAAAALAYFLLAALGIGIALPETKTRYALPFVLLAPAIVGLCLLVVYPMGYEIRLAFSNMNLRRFKEEFAFSMAAELARELDQGELSAPLMLEFDNQYIFLNPQAVVEVNRPRSNWTIIDNGTRYSIRREQQALNVYIGGPTYSLEEGWANLKEVFTLPVLKRAMFLPSMRDATGDLFDIDLALVAELENNVLSAQLREQFATHGIVLSSEAAVTVSGAYPAGGPTGFYWSISDAETMYTVIRQEGRDTLLVQGPTRYLDPGLLFRTILWTGVQVPCHVFGGLILALLLNRKMRLRGLYRALLVIPWALPPIVAVLAWRGEFHYEYGFINIMLRGLGLAAVQWKTDPTANFIAMNIVNVWLGIPFMMVILLGGLQSVPSELYEAAEIDGASWWQQFRKITWPLLQPVMTPAIVLGVIWTFNNFNVPFFINDYELETSDILVTALFRAAFQYSEYGFAAAFALVIFAILLSFSVFYIHTTGALRGVTEAAPGRRRRFKLSLRRGGQNRGQ